MTTTLRPLISDLRDATRYASNWEAAPGVIRRLCDRLEESRKSFNEHTWQLSPEDNRAYQRMISIHRRAMGNLEASLELLVTSPGVLRGYLSGAAAELESACEWMDRHLTCQPEAFVAMTESTNDEPAGVPAP